jgi:hypothetical protein
MSTAPEHLFAVACPMCRATVGVDRGLAGEAARCPLCQAGFLVPSPGPVRPAERPRPPAPTEAGGGLEAAATGATAPASSVAAETAVPPIDGRPVRAAYQETLPRHVGDDAGSPPGRGRHTADERSRRRSRRTLVIMIGGITILLVLAALLGRRPRRPRR